MQAYAILKSTNGKTWEIFGSPKSSLSVIKKYMLKVSENNIKDGEQLMIVKVHDKKYVANMKHNICQECGKPYEYSGKLELEEKDVQLHDSNE